jgi:hypothetical protein
MTNSNPGGFEMQIIDLSLFWRVGLRLNCFAARTSAITDIDTVTVAQPSRVTCPSSICLVCLPAPFSCPPELSSQHR